MKQTSVLHSANTFVFMHALPSVRGLTLSRMAETVSVCNAACKGALRHCGCALAGDSPSSGGARASGSVRRKMATSERERRDKRVKV